MVQHCALIATRARRRPLKARPRCSQPCLGKPPSVSLTFEAPLSLSRPELRGDGSNEGVSAVGSCTRWRALLCERVAEKHFSALKVAEQAGSTKQDSEEDDNVSLAPEPCFLGRLRHTVTCYDGAKRQMVSGTLLSATCLATGTTSAWMPCRRPSSMLVLSSR